MLFEQYLINIGIRSTEFMYGDNVLLKNTIYFKKCFEQGLSAYKALLFLDLYIKGEYDI